MRAYTSRISRDRELGCGCAGRADAGRVRLCAGRPSSFGPQRSLVRLPSSEPSSEPSALGVLLPTAVASWPRRRLRSRARLLASLPACQPKGPKGREGTASRSRMSFSKQAKRKRGYRTSAALSRSAALALHRAGGTAGPWVWPPRCARCPRCPRCPPSPSRTMTPARR